MPYPLPSSLLVVCRSRPERIEHPTHSTERPSDILKYSRYNNCIQSLIHRSPILPYFFTPKTFS